MWHCADAISAQRHDLASVLTVPSVSLVVSTTSATSGPRRLPYSVLFLVAIMLSSPDESLPEPTDRAWTALDGIADVELWVAEHDQQLQRYVTRSHSTGHSICFTLLAGGEIYLHTTGEGEIVLDVTPEATWAAPVISAATGTLAPSTQLWVLPGDMLTQLVLGLNSLISASRIVTGHHFRARR